MTQVIASADPYASPILAFFNADQKSRLYSNIAAAMGGVPEFIIERQLGRFAKIHPDYAAGVRAALDSKGNA